MVRILIVYIWLCESWNSDCLTWTVHRRLHLFAFHCTLQNRLSDTVLPSVAKLFSVVLKSGKI